MYKSLFFDMDETLCDTTHANRIAQEKLAKRIKRDLPSQVNESQFVEAYLLGIYKIWTHEQRQKYQPLHEKHGEFYYRNRLIRDLLTEQGAEIDNDYAVSLHEQFEIDRMAAFDFFPGLRQFLVEARKSFTLVVITNGPEFSQLPKLKTVKMGKLVDHIIVGGQEPEQKPARSIFEKAMSLANCSAKEAIHIGDSLEADIAGAHNANLHSVWIRHGQPPSDEIHPTYSLKHPTEIPEFIRQL